MEPEPGFFESYLSNVLKGFVDHPEDIEISRTLDNYGVLLTFRVHKNDMGKVLGKEGIFITKTLRPLFHAVGLKHGAKLSLKVNEPVGGKREGEAGQKIEKTLDQVVDEMGI